MGEIAYFKFRGVALPARLMHAYANDSATVKTYDLPTDSLPANPTMQDLGATYGKMEATSSGAEWYEKKHTLGLDFPTLPYYIDGDVKLTQTLAIGVFLEEKHELEPEDISAAALGRVVMLMEVGREWFDQFRMMLLPKPKEVFDEMLQGYRAHTLPKNLQRLEALLSKHNDGRNFLFKGEHPSMADFVFFDYVDLMMHLDEAEVNKYAKVMAYQERIRQLPAVKKLAEEEPTAFWPAFPSFLMWGY